MLRELRIKDFTIIDGLSITFGQGFNVLTGETGAGKSIIVDALGLLLGEKASQDLIRTGKAEARVEAVFDPVSIPLLDELSIDSSDGIILRRVLSSKGKGKAFVNDTTVSLQTIAAVGKELVDIHGQHEHQGLLKKESHLAFIDSFGGLTGESAALQTLYQEISALRERVSKINEKIRERSQRIEYLKFQITEIDAAALKGGEKQALEEERAVLMNANRLRESAEAAYAMLYGSEESTLSQLSQAANHVRDMAQIDKGAEEALALLKSALPLMEDASGLLRKLKETYDIDPNRLSEVDDRVDLIKKLEKKYGEGIEGILQYREKAEEELQGLEHAEEQRGEYEKELAGMEGKLAAVAEALSRKRKAVADSVSKLVVHELKELGFQKAEFVTDIKRKNEVSATGIDDIEFLFSANPGEPPRPLIKVASGGELSRIMLGLKCLEIGKEQETMSGRSGRPGTLIFDEVDAGIGGVTAQHVGARLGGLAGNYQVLCITHLPQIAARAGHHLKVEKDLKQNVVRVKVELLEGEKRREELARMLGGRITDKSLEHAEEMLAGEKKH
jgi:DNA repair protein RecN (Recombination protein N)